MRVFLTGATGFIGSAIAQHLVSTGHTVLGLARSDDAAKRLRAVGIEPHHGELSDTDSLAAGARAADGVIHAAFIHDFVHYAANAEIDRKAIEAIVGALAASDKPFVATTVTTLLEPGRVGTEEDNPAAQSALGPRGASEAALLAAATRGVRSSAVRLPPSVHGDGDAAFVPALIAMARAKGEAAYIGDGANRWPAVHRLDAARLFCLALEKAPAGSRLHAVADEGVPMREIATAIGERLGLPVRGVAPEEAPAQFEWLAHFVAVDNPMSSALTRALVGWMPREVDLLTDLRHGSYFG